VVLLSHFKYVPVLRYRSQERKALNNNSISNKILPLIEVVSEKPTKKSRNTSLDKLIQDINKSNIKVMLDFPMYLKLKKNTDKNVIDFIQPILVDQQKRIDLLTSTNLVKNKNQIIPVVTYNPNIPFLKNYLSKQETNLRPIYNQIAFRIYPQHFIMAFNEIKDLVKTDDIILLDLDELSHKDENNKQLYKIINMLCKSVRCHSVIIRSAIPKKLSNVQLKTHAIVAEADNSLLRDYKKLGFSAFGDYCGVKKDELKTGGIISPGYLMYSWLENSYYGFKGIVKDASSFENILVPSIISSKAWNSFSVIHQTNCTGCNTISNISKKLKKGKSQPEWKGFACAHYLYTMEEFL